MDGFQSQRYSAVKQKDPSTDPSSTSSPPGASGGPATPPPPSYTAAVSDPAPPSRALYKETNVDEEGSTSLQGVSVDAGHQPPVARSNRRHLPSRPTSFSDMKQPLIIVGIIVGIIAVLVVIIIPMSFATLEYNEYGFKRRKSTGEIDRSKAFGPGGRHFLGPDYEFRTMIATAHYETFNSVSVFAKDRLQVSISAHMQYFIRKSQMHLLHKKYDVRYRPILLTNALNALKNRATSFETREFIRNRTLIEDELFLAVREMLSGPCCEEGCKKTRTCTRGCKAQCSEREYGFYVDVRYFQLDTLEIPNDLESKFLKGLVLKEESETEKYKQNATIVRKETNAQVQQIQNEAREIRQSATAQSELIRSVARANATAIVEKSRSDGLKHLYGELEITDQKHKASFDYLRTLRGQENVHLAVDFQQLITGNLGG